MNIQWGNWFVDDTGDYVFPEETWQRDWSAPFVHADRCLHLRFTLAQYRPSFVRRRFGEPWSSLPSLKLVIGGVQQTISTIQQLGRAMREAHGNARKFCATLRLRCMRCGTDDIQQDPFTFYCDDCTSERETLAALFVATVVIGLVVGVYFVGKLGGYLP